jgi:hypothetical protein
MKYTLYYFSLDNYAYTLARELGFPIQYSSPDVLIGHFAISFNTEMDSTAFQELVEEHYNMY